MPENDISSLVADALFLLTLLITLVTLTLVFLNLRKKLNRVQFEAHSFRKEKNTGSQTGRGLELRRRLHRLDAGFSEAKRQLDHLLSRDARMHSR